MKGVRLTKPELAAALAALEEYGGQHPVEKKYADSARDKLELAGLALKVPQTRGIGLAAGVAAMESVLGPRSIAMPPHPDNLWCIKINARIKSLGLTVEDFKSMATALSAKGWNPPYSFERAVWSAERLIAESKDGGGAKPNHDYYRAPKELDGL